MDAKKALEECTTCIHSNDTYTCGASLCKLGNSRACIACAYLKYDGKFNGQDMPEPLKCENFKNKLL